MTEENIDPSCDNCGKFVDERSLIRIENVYNTRELFLCSRCNCLNIDLIELKKEIIKYG